MKEEGSLFLKVQRDQDSRFEQSILTMAHERDHFKVPLVHTEVTLLHDVIKVNMKGRRHERPLDFSAILKVFKNS